MTTTTTILSETVHHAAHPVHCPCGCGAKSTDYPATRYRIIETGRGQELDIARSIDDGRTFGPGGWQPVNSLEGIDYGLRMAAPATTIVAYLQARRATLDV